jgi:hypothetical protein
VIRWDRQPTVLKVPLFLLRLQAQTSLNQQEMKSLVAEVPFESLYKIVDIVSSISANQKPQNIEEAVEKHAIKIVLRGIPDLKLTITHKNVRFVPQGNMVRPCWGKMLLLTIV